jgi:hypothetical protein
MLVISPRAIPSPIRVANTTTHVDVVPTLLDTLGIERHGMLHAGRSMLDPALAERTLPLTAGEFAPQRGLFAAGRTFSYDADNDIAALCGSTRGEPCELLEQGDQRRQRFIELVGRFAVVRESIVAELVRRAQPPTGATPAR